MKLSPVNPVRTAEALEFDYNLQGDARFKRGVDIFAAGLLLDKMLNGRGVEAPSANRLEQRMQQIEVPIPKPDEQALDLLAKMKSALRMDDAECPTAAELLLHPWIVEHALVGE